MASSKFLEHTVLWVSVAWAFCPKEVGDYQVYQWESYLLFAPVITLILGHTYWFWAHSLSVILLVHWLQLGECVRSQVSPPVSLNSLVPSTLHLAEIYWPFSITFSSFTSLLGSPFICCVAWGTYLTFLYLNYLIYKMQNNGTYFIKVAMRMKRVNTLKTLE